MSCRVAFPGRSVATRKPVQGENGSSMKPEGVKDSIHFYLRFWAFRCGALYVKLEGLPCFARLRCLLLPPVKLTTNMPACAAADVWVGQKRAIPDARHVSLLTSSPRPATQQGGACRVELDATSAFTLLAKSLPGKHVIHGQCPHERRMSTSRPAPAYRLLM